MALRGRLGFPTRPQRGLALAGSVMPCHGHGAVAYNVRGHIMGGVFARSEGSPFGYNQGEGVDAGKNDTDWIVNSRRQKYDDIYKSMGPVNGKVMETALREVMMKSKLPNSVLGKIWRLADVDADGLLDKDEFALAMYLIDLRLEGHELPTQLPKHLVPPLKRVSHRPSKDMLKPEVSL